MMIHPEALPGSEPATDETMYDLYRAGVERVIEYGTLFQTDPYGEPTNSGRGMAAYMVLLSGDDIRAVIPEANGSLFADAEELIVSYSPLYTPEGEVEELEPVFRMLLQYTPVSQRPPQLLELFPRDGGVGTAWDALEEELFDIQDWMPRADGEVGPYDMQRANMQFRREQGLDRPTQLEAEELKAIADKIPELLGS